ncbi:unnamed protein product [Rhodiola kirilowii]
MASTREDHVQMTKLAHEGQRYADMVDFMEKTVLESDGKLTEEERNLLYEAYTNLIGSLLAFRNCISSVDQNMSNISAIAVDYYKTKIETEMSTICFRILKLLDFNLIPSAADDVSKKFYLEWKRHIHRRCLAVFMDRNARKKAAYQTEQPVVVPNKVSRYEQDFEHIKKLGKGGFGRVFKARHQLDNKPYAVKMVKITENNSEEAVSEARIMSCLCHCHIVRYHQAWYDSFLDVIYNANEGDSSCSELSSEDDEGSEKLFLCIQMELCHRTLHDDLTSGVDQIVKEHVLKQILEAVAYMHDQGTIHTDLSAKNIFIDSNNQVKIGDFGLATSSALGNTGFDTSIITELGNIYYRAPETKLGAKKNQKMDMYSLGIIWFELCNKFTTGTERDLQIMNVKNGVLPREWVDICPELAKLISTNPFERPSARDILENNILFLQEN